MHSEVKRLADQGDIAGLRYIFADALDVDPTFERYQEDYDYCQSKGLLEPHQELTPLTDEPSQWTKDYWAHLKVDLIKNLSARRLTHMKKVARVLMADKVQRLTAERKAAQAQKQAEEERKAAQARKQAEEERKRAQAQKQAEEKRKAAQARKQAEEERKRAQAEAACPEPQPTARPTPQSQPAGHRPTAGKTKVKTGPKKWTGIAMAAAVLVVILAIILVVLSNPGQAAAVFQAGTKFISAITTPIV